MITVDYSDLSIGIQEVKKRFESIQVDLQYLSYTTERLLADLQKVCSEIEDLGNDIKSAEIIL